MRIKTIKFTNLIFLSAALILVLLSFFSYQRINKQARASDEVSSTQLLKFKLNDAFSHLIKTETSQRGFILTHDSSFLYDYFLAQQQIPQLLSEIKTLVKNNPQQLNNFNIASNAFTRRLGYIDNTLVNHEDLSAQQLDSILLGGKLITDSLSRQIERMISTENYLLEQRIAVKLAEERRTSVIILLFSALSIGILVFSFFRIKKELFNNNILEQKVQERTEQITSANEILNKQNLELEKKNNELHSFTFIANHDLKEPLRKIELFVNRVITSNEPISIANKNLLAKSIDSVNRMKALLEDIFIYTLADRDTEFETTDLNKIAAAAIDNLQESINEKEAIIEYKNLPVLKVAPGQIEQVFTNLISNSLKYSKKETKPYIKIDAEKQNGTGHNAVWKINFIDNGIGFDEKHKEKIFEMFQRLHPKSEYSGTGIGLSICKKIVENHKGSITASSNNDDGAVFTLLLPEDRN
jgi:signal transduction histidine kinase